MPRMLILALTVAIVGLAAADRADAAFGYPGSQVVDGGDCAGIAAEIGAGATWVGEFAGEYYDDFRDASFPVSARGCFHSQAECRAWQNYVSADLGRGGIRYMRCVQGWR